MRLPENVLHHSEVAVHIGGPGGCGSVWGLVIHVNVAVDEEGLNPSQVRDISTIEEGRNSPGSSCTLPRSRRARLEWSCCRVWRKWRNSLKHRFEGHNIVDDRPIKNMDASLSRGSPPIRRCKLRRAGCCCWRPHCSRDNSTRSSSSASTARRPLATPDRWTLARRRSDRSTYSLSSKYCWACLAHSENS